MSTAESYDPTTICSPFGPSFPRLLGQSPLSCLHSTLKLHLRVRGKHISDSVWCPPPKATLLPRSARHFALAFQALWANLPLLPDSTLKLHLWREKALPWCVHTSISSALPHSPPCIDLERLLPLWRTLHFSVEHPQSSRQVSRVPAGLGSSLVKFQS